MHVTFRQLEDVLDHRENVVRSGGMPMLILDIREGESLRLGDGPNAAIMTVVEVDFWKARLGITAPRSVPVDRLEVRERRLAGAAGELVRVRVAE